MDAQFFQKYFGEKEERNQQIVVRIKGVFFFKVRDIRACLCADMLIKRDKK